MTEYNAINTVIHYFIKGSRSIHSFSVWVNESNTVVIAPEKFKSLVGKSIDEVVDSFAQKGYKHHIIN